MRHSCEDVYYKRYWLKKLIPFLFEDKIAKKILTNDVTIL